MVRDACLLCSFDFLCNQWYNDLLVTFNRCKTAGLLVADVGDLIFSRVLCKLGSGLKGFSTLILISVGILGPNDRTSSLRLSLRSLIIVSFTSNCCLSEPAPSSWTPKIMNMSSLINSPATKTCFNLKTHNPVSIMSIKRI